MKKLVAALTLALTVLSAITPADAARRNSGGNPYCYENGCTGSKCIYCTR